MGDYQDAAIFVQSREEHSAKCCGGRVDLLDLVSDVVRVIDNNHVGAPAREAALKGCDEHASPSRGAEIRDFGMSLFESRCEKFLEPGRL